MGIVTCLKLPIIKGVRNLLAKVTCLSEMKTLGKPYSTTKILLALVNSLGLDRMLLAKVTFVRLVLLV